MKVVIADDHKVVRDGIRWMLSEEPHIEIAGEAASGPELLSLIAGTPEIGRAHV